MRGEAVPNISPISNPCSRGQFEKINGSSSSFDNSRDMEKSSVKILIGGQVSLYLFFQRISSRR